MPSTKTVANYKFLANSNANYRAWTSETVLEASDPLHRVDHDGSGRLEYVRGCQRRKCQTKLSVLQQLPGPAMVLRDYPLEPRAQVSSGVQHDGFEQELAHPEAQALAEALAVNRTVQRLVITSPLSSDRGARVLLRAVAKANGVLDLTLHIRSLSPQSIGILGGLLARASPPCALRRIDLSKTVLGDRGLSLLSKSLRRHGSLKHLMVSRCQVGEAGALALAAVLGNDGGAGGLEELDLSWNSIPPSGMAAVCLALAGELHSPPAHVCTVNVTLTNLDLSWNRIGGGGGGVRALARCLERNSSLVRLDLRHTCLQGSDGEVTEEDQCEASVLAAGLAANDKRLRVVRLEGNSIGGNAKVMRALLACAPLLMFDIEPGPAHANPEQLWASLLPYSALAQNASGHYRFLVTDPAQQKIAVQILRRILIDGPETCRNELIEGKPVRLLKLLAYVEAGGMFERKSSRRTREVLPRYLGGNTVLETGEDDQDAQNEEKGEQENKEKGIVEFDYNEKRVGLELISAEDGQQALAAIKQLRAPVLRLGLLRQLSADFQLDSYLALQLLAAVPPGIERQEALVILRSRLDPTLVPAVARLMGEGSMHALTRRMGPLTMFDRTNPGGHFVLRLDRRSDREVLAQMFELAAMSARTNARQKNTFVAITIVGLDAMAAKSPAAIAAAATRARAHWEERMKSEGIEASGQAGATSSSSKDGAGEQQGDGDEPQDETTEKKPTVIEELRQVESLPFCVLPNSTKCTNPSSCCHARTLTRGHTRQVLMPLDPHRQALSAFAHEQSHLRYGASVPGAVATKFGSQASMRRLWHWARGNAADIAGGAGELQEVTLGGDEVASLQQESTLDDDVVEVSAPSRVTEEQRKKIQDVLAARGSQLRFVNLIVFHLFRD